jgi:TolA-binding protein
MNTSYDIHDPEYKRIKYEVFEKDAFKCQFCGTGAPNVTLQLVRIQDAQPDEEWLDTAFLSTSCKVCEKKKSGTDEKSLNNPYMSIDELEERLQQLKMLINWRKGMLNIRKQQLNNLIIYWENKISGFETNNDQKKYLAAHISKYSGDEIRSAMDMAVDKFIKYDEDGKLDQSSILTAFSKIPEICQTKTEIVTAHESDGLQRIHDQLSSNIAGFFDTRRTQQWLNYARSWEVQIDDLYKMASSVKSWTEFSVNIDKMVEKQKYVLSRGRVDR